MLIAKKLGYSKISAVVHIRISMLGDLGDCSAISQYHINELSWTLSRHS